MSGASDRNSLKEGNAHSSITITTEELLNWSMGLSETIALKLINKGIAPKDAIPEASTIVKSEVSKLLK